MADDAHDVSTRAVFIDGVTQRLAIEGQAGVLEGELRDPESQRLIERLRIDAHEPLADDLIARRRAAALRQAAAKAPPGVPGQIRAPLPHVPIAAQVPDVEPVGLVVERATGECAKFCVRGIA